LSHAFPIAVHSLIRDAMRGRGMVALARVVLAKRERVIMLQPWDKGLMGTTLRYPCELRDSKEYFDELPSVKVAPDMLKLAQHILDTKEADFDPSQFVDHYEEAVVEMLKKKQGGLATPKGKVSEPPRNVINLMDALKKSVASDTPRGRRRKKRLSGYLRGQSPNCHCGRKPTATSALSHKRSGSRSPATAKVIMRRAIACRTVSAPRS
jgi:DNA end-binding protein Ku